MAGDALFLLPGATKQDPAVEAWFSGDGLRLMAHPWFERMRASGPDVREILHDHCPTACVADAAFAYVGAFTAHVNVGFFHGADLPDPHRLLTGSGKRMRHVKLHWGQPIHETGLRDLIAAAYADIRRRLDGD
jgi:hypothetical protein